MTTTKTWIIIYPGFEQMIEVIVQYNDENAFGYAYGYTKQNEGHIPDKCPKIWDLNYIEDPITTPLTDGNQLEEKISLSKQYYEYVPKGKDISPIITKLYSSLSSDTPEIQNVIIKKKFHWDDLARLFNEISTPILVH